MISDHDAWPCFKMLFSFQLDLDIKCSARNPVKAKSHDAIHVVLLPSTSHHSGGESTTRSDSEQRADEDADAKIISTHWCEPCHNDDRREVGQRLDEI